MQVGQSPSPNGAAVGTYYLWAASRRAAPWAAAGRATPARFSNRKISLPIVLSTKGMPIRHEQFASLNYLSTNKTGAVSIAGVVDSCLCRPLLFV